MTAWIVAGIVLAQDRGADVHALDEALRKQTRCLNPEYLVYSPAARPEGGPPLVIYLHGAGGVGEDIQRLRGQAGRIWDGIVKFAKEPALLVAPQCLKQARDDKKGIWDPSDLDVLLKHLEETLRFDRDRVYLTGNSMGGYGSWAWGGHSPDHFAAIAPVVGGIGPGGPKDVTPDLESWAANLAKVPVYAFAGGKDRVVPAERSERMVAAIRKAGGTKVRLRIYEEESHNAGRKVFGSAELYDWMFAQKRGDGTR